MVTAARWDHLLQASMWACTFYRAFLERTDGKFHHQDLCWKEELHSESGKLTKEQVARA